MPVMRCSRVLGVTVLGIGEHVSVPAILGERVHTRVAPDVERQVVAGSGRPTKVAGFNSVAIRTFVQPARPAHRRSLGNGDPVVLRRRHVSVALAVLVSASRLLSVLAPIWQG